jgi:MarR family transcriptional regulator for hemolysin
MDFFGYDAIFKKKIKKSYKFIEKKYKLTKNELIIISYLAENSESNLSSDIVKNLGFSKSHVSLSVANLIKSGYLNTISNKQDKKKMHLVLKDKASEIINDIKTVKTNFENQLFSGFSDNEKKQFSALLKKVVRNVKA